MTHIEAKSLEKWLRYQWKQVNMERRLCDGSFRLYFTSYLSYLSSDFASIWVILMLFAYQILHIRIYSKFEYNDERIFQIRILKRAIFFGRSIHHIKVQPDLTTYEHMKRGCQV